MGDGQNLLKNLRALSIYKDLSNETTFSLIHLAGKYLLILLFLHPLSDISLPLLCTYTYKQTFHPCNNTFFEMNRDLKWNARKDQLVPGKLWEHIWFGKQRENQPSYQLINDDICSLLYFYFMGVMNFLCAQCDPQFEQRVIPQGVLNCAHLRDTRWRWGAALISIISHSY